MTIRPAYRTVSSCLVLALVHLAWGLDLLLEPTRWTSTPAYGNLFQVLPEWLWGVIYLVASLLLLLSAWLLHRLRVHGVVFFAIGFNLVLTVAWGVAFLIRYLTDAHTTPFTFGSSIVQAFLLVTASRALSRDGL